MPLSVTLPVPVSDTFTSKRNVVVLFRPVVFTKISPLFVTLLAKARSAPGTRLRLAVLVERLSDPIWNWLVRLHGAAIEITTSKVLLAGTMLISQLPAVSQALPPAPFVHVAVGAPIDSVANPTNNADAAIANLRNR